MTEPTTTTAAQAEERSYDEYRVVQDLGGWKRSHTCNQLTAANIGEEVTLMGWVQFRRDHGGLIFIDLRDREGLTQTVFSPEEAPEAHERAHAIRIEYVVALRGIVRHRPEGMTNPNMNTGEVEVYVKEWKLLNTSETPPFPIEDRVETSEMLRLKYRYLDLRRPRLAKNFILRNKAAQSVRRYLDGLGFLEIETPVLTKSTPEGARDFLVPSRLNPGTFYALPQSPQIFKQLLMMASLGVEFLVVGQLDFSDGDKQVNVQLKIYDPKGKTWTQSSQVPLEGLLPALERLSTAAKTEVFKRPGDDAKTAERKEAKAEAAAKMPVPKNADFVIGDTGEAPVGNAGGPVMNPQFRYEGGAETPGRWQSQSLRFPSVGMVAGDFVGDKKNRVIIAETNTLHAYEFFQNTLKPIGDIKLGMRTKILRVSLYDMDHDGKEEIIASGLDDPEGNAEPRTFIFRFNNGKFEEFMREYVPRLVERVLSTAATPIRADFDLDETRLPVTRSVPFGLILNELVMNTVKHAFSPTRGGKTGGTLTVSLRRDGPDNLRLKVEDDGPGLPPGFDYTASPTLGMTLLISLTRQIGGRLHAENRTEGGARFSLVFPVVGADG